MTDLSTLRFFSTPAHACSYLEDRKATTLFVDPNAEITPELYRELSSMGFRRSGDYLYRPHCKGCQACIPVRIPVQEFTLRRRHKRIMKRNSDLDVELIPARFQMDLYRLYSRYIESRHGDGDMYPPSEEQFASFLMSDWSETHFCCFRLNGELVAVAVVDQLRKGLSAVYTFFDPNLATRSLGTYAILWQIEHCQSEQIPHLYLGYWIRDCQKMSYKDQFAPLEYFTDGHWYR